MICLVTPDPGRLLQVEQARGRNGGVVRMLVILDAVAGTVFLLNHVTWDQRWVRARVFACVRPLHIEQII